MDDFFYRTEQIRTEDILNYFVETKEDRTFIDTLKSHNPVILIGSRGIGKSFLLRVAQCELEAIFDDYRIFPVYITFHKSSLIHTTDPLQFQHWMLSRICTRIIRTLRKSGLLSTIPYSFPILTGSGDLQDQIRESPIEKISKAFENSWQTPEIQIDIDSIPTIEQFKDAIEDLCQELKIKRMILFIDEAAHILIPEQQRQFFTLFRDLHNPYLTCNAAVYPGVTSYGETFQPIHDATMLTINRNIWADGYISNMREIVEKQAESSIVKNIQQHGQNFATLAYAATGNPRLLLKTIARAPKMSSSQVNQVIREYYREDIWSEHSNLAEKYYGHREIIDWGRRFIEEDILPTIKSKNDEYLTSDKKTSCFFWMHRDAPQAVIEALRLLSYTGVVNQHSTGIKGTRSEIGTRYMVNLGSLFSFENRPAVSAFDVVKNVSIKRMTEYGSQHPKYEQLINKVPKLSEINGMDILKSQLFKPISVLDITEWQKDQLINMKLNTIGDVLKSTETKLRQAQYVGEKRARRMRNAAIAAVYEYLSG